MDFCGFVYHLHVLQALCLWLVLIIGDSSNQFPFSYVHVGSCGDRNTIFRSFWGISLYECLVECGLRQKCVALNHRQSYDNLCELLDGTNVISDESGCLYVRRENIDFNSQYVTDCSCIPGEMCDKITGTCSKQECDPIRSINNGVVTGNRFTIGSSYIISCDDPYEPENNVNMATCMHNGQWNVIPNCSLKECNPFTITNGNLIGSDYTVGAALTVSCNDGYEEENNINTVNCLSTRQWDYFPVCIEQPCPSGWIRVDASCFYLSTESDGQFSWPDSLIECEKKQGYLAGLDTQQKNEFFRSELYQMGYPGDYGYRIGLKKVSETWTWTATNTYMTYEDWAVGHPGERKYNCVYFWGSDRHWHVKRCGANERYICERPVAT